MSVKAITYHLEFETTKDKVEEIAGEFKQFGLVESVGFRRSILKFRMLMYSEPEFEEFETTRVEEFIKSYSAEHDMKYFYNISTKKY